MDKNFHRILIVDDEFKIIEVVKSFLESKNFVVFYAENGKQAFEIIAREKISLVLLDLMLPDISGEEICKIIRKKSRVPIIMLTAKVEEEDMLKGFDIGADDYITKPFSLKALQVRIEAVLRRSDNNIMPLYSKSSFKQGDLEIDFTSRVIQKQQKEVSLTPNEFKILSALSKYPEKAFTREELIEIALGEDFDGFDRSIDNHIKNLRQKIETNPKDPDYIVTVHGIGYKFKGV